MQEIFELYQELRSLSGENNPVTEFTQKIRRIIQETIDQIPDEARIAIRPAGADTRELLRLFDFSRKNIIGIVNQGYRGEDYCGYPCFTTDSFPIESCDYVLISSFDYHQAIKKEIGMLHIPYIDYCDELEKQGIQLPFPFHFYLSYPQMAVNYFYLRYLRSEAGPQRELTLNTLLQAAVEYKDFVLISNIYQDCGGEDGEFPLLKVVWEKSSQLLDRIQNKFQERKQKDIILLWADSVPYNRFHYLPKTMELSRQGTLFQRTYAPAPYTNGALRAMFRSMLPIDDFSQNHIKIGSENSSLIQFMEHEGYKVRFVGDSKRAMGEEHLIEVQENDPCSAKWWKGMADLLQSPEPCFYIFHFMESHPPFFVPDIKEPVNLDAVTKTQWEEHVRSVYGYMDQCLLLYHKLSGNKTQIFLSDHGLVGPRSDMTIRAVDSMLHPYCFVVGRDIPKTTVTRFFPYTNFEKLIRWLVDPTRFPLDDACTDEVVIQDIDYYNSKLIDPLIKTDHEVYGVAFRGIVSYDYKYVINALGEEFFYQMQPDGSEKLVPLEDPALRAELQDKAGTKFLDIYQYDKFRYTRQLYESINRKRSSGNAT